MEGTSISMVKKPKAKKFVVPMQEPRQTIEPESVKKDFKSSSSGNQPMQQLPPNIRGNGTNQKEGAIGTEPNLEMKVRPVKKAQMDEEKTGKPEPVGKDEDKHAPGRKDSPLDFGARPVNHIENRKKPFIEESKTNHIRQKNERPLTKKDGPCDAKAERPKPRVALKKRKRDSLEEALSNDGESSESEGEVDLQSDSEGKAQSLGDSSQESPERKLPIGVYMRKNRNENLVHGYNLRTKIGAKSESKEVEADDKQILRAKHSVRNSMKVFVSFSGFSGEDKLFLKQICRNLKNNQVVEDSLLDFTHLVVADKIRTKKVIFAIVRHCWILSREYLYKCLESGGWVAEEDHELVGFPKKADRPNYRTFFVDTKYYIQALPYSGDFDYSSLKQLLSICRCNITSSEGEAERIVSNKLEDSDRKGNKIDYLWFFECITQGSVVDAQHYIF